MNYAKQMDLKEKIVLDNFQRILKEQSVSVFPICGSPLEKNYRNKIEFSFGKYITGKSEEKNILSNWSL
jgi:tRNA/tmRNA/rRNA uracil-C5-methylase (TrmA/RlmC/RlmD family)